MKIEKPNFNPISIAKEYFPLANEEELNFIIWEYTGYPSFWNIGKDGKTSEECFRKQLSEFKEGRK